MKKTFIVALALLVWVALPAQNNRPQGLTKENIEKFKDGAKERIRSEHIAYLTAELELSPEEAQAFWPVYNQAADKQRAQHCEVSAAKKALKAAVKEGKSDSEIREALNAYNKARAAQHDIMAEYQKDFEKILGVAKTAKLYLAEDSFRTRQINKLGGGKSGGNRQNPGNRQYNGQRPHTGPRQGAAKGPDNC